MSDQTQPADHVGAAECTRCGALLVPGTTATGTEQCAACLWGPDPDWRAEDDAVPPQCRGCGAAIIPGVTALPWGTPRRRERCQDCAVVGQCSGCGTAIVAGYNDATIAETWRGRLCVDCGPDPVLEGDVLAVIDPTMPDAYHSQDTII